jgi:hypothetical protein
LFNPALLNEPDANALRLIDRGELAHKRRARYNEAPKDVSERLDDMSLRSWVALIAIRLDLDSLLRYPEKTGFISSQM